MTWQRPRSLGLRWSTRPLLIGRALRGVELPDPAQLGDRLVVPVDAQIDDRPIVNLGDVQAGGAFVSGLTPGGKADLQRTQQPLGERCIPGLEIGVEHVPRHVGGGEQVAQRVGRFSSRKGSGEGPSF